MVITLCIFVIITFILFLIAIFTQEGRADNIICVIVAFVFGVISVVMSLIIIGDWLWKHVNIVVN